ncbi:MAG: hypothetical protein ACPHRO_13945, partial [Nannocystaceae bacterium]
MIRRLSSRLYKVLGLQGVVVILTVLMVILGDLVGGIFLEQRLRHQFELNSASTLHRAAIVTEEFLSTQYEQPTAPDVDEIADRVSTLIGTRITIMSDDGTVLGDSSLDGEALRSVENHRDRPEVRGALASGESSSSRYSATIEMDMLYLARSYSLDTVPPTRMVVRVARPLSELDDQILTLRYILLLAGLMTLIPVGIAGTLFSTMLSRKVRRILSSAPDPSTLLGGGLPAAAPGWNSRLGSSPPRLFV